MSERWRSCVEEALATTSPESWFPRVVLRSGGPGGSSVTFRLDDGSDGVAMLSGDPHRACKLFACPVSAALDASGMPAVAVDVVVGFCYGGDARVAPAPLCNMLTHIGAPPRRFRVPEGADSVVFACLGRAERRAAATALATLGNHL